MACMMKTRSISQLLLALGCASLVVAGCGGGDKGSVDDGSSTATTETATTQTSGDSGGDDAKAKELFTTSCGSCHALAATGSTGAVGPDLDKTSMDAAAIDKQIIEGSGSMPAGLLKGDDAKLVAEFIAANKKS